MAVLDVQVRGDYRLGLDGCLGDFVCEREIVSLSSILGFNH